jgi:predicted GNAT family acetyltransferase
MHLLDNPIWKALTTRQDQFAQISGQAGKFPHEVTTLASFSEPSSESVDSLAELLEPGETVGLFLLKPVFLPPRLKSVRELQLLQMVHENSSPATRPGTSSQSSMIELVPNDVPQMIQLAKLTEPGPFGSRTRELGTYLGIFHHQQLVAMAGERLKVHGYTEISAVCTHPEYTGKGYATALVRELVGRIRARGECPILHVRQDNHRAADVYKRLGFAERITFHLMVVRREV